MASSGGQARKPLEHRRDIVPAQTVIAVPSLFLAGDQPAFLQLAEMRAGRLLRDPRLPCQFARGQRAAAHQGGENIRPRRVAHKRGDERDIRSGFHISMIIEAFAFSQRLEWVVR